MPADDLNLRRYIDQRIKDEQRVFDEYVRGHEAFTHEALDGIRAAAVRAADSTEKRFDKQDELRQAQEERVAALIPRAETEARISALDARVAAETKSTSEKIDTLRTNVDQGAFVTREFFDRYAKDQDERHGRVLDQLGVVFTEQSNMKGKMAAYATALGIGLTILTIAVSVLTRVF